MALQETLFFRTVLWIMSTILSSLTRITAQKKIALIRYFFNLNYTMWVQSFTIVITIMVLLHIQSSGVEINGVTYKNIKGTSASKVAMSFSCSGSHPCRHINLQDIHLSGFNGPTPGSYCKNVKGSTTGLVVPTSCFWFYWFVFILFIYFIM